jgi:hypothetical protein
MFDEMSQTEEAKETSEDDEKPARSWSQWSHVIGGITFCLLYFPFRGHVWAQPAAFAASYTVFVFAIGLGLSLYNLDDLFGDPRVPEYALRLLLLHSIILVPATLLAYLWFRATPLLPSWATEVHRISFWQLCGIIPLWFIGTREGIWLAGKMKRRLKELDL